MMTMYRTSESRYVLLADGVPARLAAVRSYMDQLDKILGVPMEINLRVLGQGQVKKIERENSVHELFDFTDSPAVKLFNQYCQVAPELLANNLQRPLRQDGVRGSHRNGDIELIINIPDKGYILKEFEQTFQYAHQWNDREKKRSTAVVFCDHAMLSFIVEFYEGLLIPDCRLANFKKTFTMGLIWHGPKEASEFKPEEYNHTDVRWWGTHS